MTTVIIDDETARAIVGHEDVELRDRHGRLLGYLAPGVAAADIELALQRRESNDPRMTLSEVMSVLASTPF